MGFFKSENKFPVRGRTVIITGGSQGMGKAVAKELARKGANVVVVARNVDKLRHALESIKADAINPETQRFHYISADLTNPEESVRILLEVKVWNHDNPPDIVWCLAGSARPGFFIETDVRQLRDGMDQNYWSAAYMAHATLKEWLQLSSSPGSSTSQEPRHIVFTSSILAFFSMVGYTSYAPTKSALRSLSDALSQELLAYNGARRKQGAVGPETDVKIHTVFPATIYSPGYEEENITKPTITKKLEESDEGQSEQEVAVASIKGLERGESLVTTTFIGSILRGGALGGSLRNSWVLDTMLSWVASLVWIFFKPDMDRKVFKWGKENGHPATLGTKS
ncbi:MAG: 3-dehydrosphinganine reductase [Sclerophora amabilis]|nr:MAG: 3-dehydrosphinganine reductase [Sclerophora amabilis]